MVNNQPNKNESRPDSEGVPSAQGPVTSLPNDLQQEILSVRAGQTEGRTGRIEELCRRHPKDATEIRGFVEALEQAEDRVFAAVQKTSPAPEQIGPYRILSVLGEGGMGTVYIAEQKKPVRRRVALKVIKLGMDSREVLLRFEAERQALAMMSHDGIAKVLDAGTTERGQAYFVMEHITGMPITDHCDRHRLSTRERLQLFQQVCEAVQHAHQKGIIHRDLKPSNILVSVDQGRAVPKIIDFGVARATDHRLTEATIFTEQGQIIGTPEYMSPEQAEMSSQDIDTRTDVYSLGVILYELLVGELPFPAAELRKAGLLEIQRKIREDEPPKPSTRITGLGAESTHTAQRRKTTVVSLVRELREDLDWIVLRALEKDRNRRYPTPVGLAEDIEKHLTHQPVNAGPPSAAYRMRKFVRRYRGQVVATTLLFLALVAGAIGTTTFAWQASREAEQRRAIEYERLLARGEEANPASFANVVKSETEEQPETGEMSRSIFSQAIALDPDRPDAYWMRALTPGDIEDNLGDLTSAETHGLSSGTAHWLKACLLIAQNRFAEAEGERELAESFAAALTPVNAYAKAQFLDLLGEKEAALALLSDAIERSDSVAIIRYLALRHRARMFEEMDRPEEALSNLFKIQGLGDDSMFVRIRIAFQWRSLGREETADEIFARALGEVRRSDDPTDWYELSRACHDPNETEWQDQVSREAVQAHPESVWLLIERTDSLFHQGDNDGAIDMSRRALALDPSNPWTHHHHGIALLEKGRLDEAIAAHREVIRLDPNQSYAYYFLGIALGKNGQQDDAIAAYREALKRKPYDVETYFNLGMALGENGQLDEAFAAYREAIRLDPNHSRSYEHLGIALGNDGQLDEAFAAYKEAIRLDPTHAHAYEILGDALQSNGQLDEAFAAYREMVRLNPNDAPSNEKLGMALGNDGQLDEAIAAYRELIRLDPNHAHAYELIGNALSNNGQLDEAIAAYRELIRLDPNYPLAYENLGLALANTGQLDEAIMAYREAIRLDPNHAHAYVLLGNALGIIEQLDEAIAAYKEAIRLDPNYALAYSSLGIALGNNGYVDEAIAAYKEAIRLDPNYALAYENLGMALGNDGQLDEAISAYREAIRLDPNHAHAYDLLGNVLGNKGQFDEAIAAYRELIRLNPNYPLAYNNLGVAFLQQRKLEDANEALITAFRLDSEDSGLAYNLACVYALKGDKDKAFEWLLKAAEAGWNDTAHMARDSDMDSLRDDPRYDKIIALMEGKKE